ncbi:MAG: hypothetical protein U0637_12750 [Phycisphaerales bacterium]
MIFGSVDTFGIQLIPVRDSLPQYKSHLFGYHVAGHLFGCLQVDQDLDAIIFGALQSVAERMGGMDNNLLWSMPPNEALAMVVSQLYSTKRARLFSGKIEFNPRTFLLAPDNTESMQSTAMIMLTQNNHCKIVAAHMSDLGDDRNIAPVICQTTTITREYVLESYQSALRYLSA